MIDLLTTLLTAIVRYQQRHGLPGDLLSMIRKLEVDAASIEHDV